MESVINAPVNTILSQGLLGALLLLSGVAIVFLAKGRYSDWKEIGEIAKNDATVMANFISSNETRNRIAEKSADSQALSAAAQTAMATAISNLSGDVRALTASNVALREALAKKGVDL